MTEAYRIEEFFYAATLETKGASTTWKQWAPDQRLQLRQVILGHTAKPNDFNVIEVEAPSTNGRQTIPIAILKIGKPGEKSVLQTNLEFPKGPVTFKLVEGEGPVHLMGQHLPPDPAGELCDEEEEEEEEEEEDLFDDANEVDKPDLIQSSSDDMVGDEEAEEMAAKKRIRELGDDDDDDDFDSLLRSSSDEDEDPERKRRKKSPNFVKNRRVNY